MISKWDLNRSEETANRVMDDSPLTWDEYNEICHHPAGVQRANHLLRRLQLATVPEDIRGIVEIRVKRAKGKYV